MLGGGILLYVKADILSNLFEVETKPIKDFYVEINLYSDKWLTNCSYNPHKNVTGNQLRDLSEKIDIYFSSFVILDDFNIGMEEQRLFVIIVV